jgi:hypothetical protein
MPMQMHMDYIQTKEFAKDPQLEIVLLLVTAVVNVSDHKRKPELANPTLDVMQHH